MKVLVLGSNGQLGRCLKEQEKNLSYKVYFTSRKEIDIANIEATRKNISDIAPDIIINTAAYTAVDRAEEDIENANIINNHAVANIASICNELNCLLIHVSTDYVFDGKSSIPYKESEQTNPQAIYGKTKLEGELAIKSSGCKYIILRTSWVFSEYGKNFLKTMLILGSKYDELSVVDDQIGCPSYAQDIAKAIYQIVSLVNIEEQFCNIYHFCGDNACSWFTFSKAIFEEAKNLGIRTPSTINPVKTSAYKTMASRPAFSVLNCSKIEKDFAITPSNWQKGIKDVLKKLNINSLQYD